MTKHGKDKYLQLGDGANLTTRIHLLQMIKMSGAIPALPRTYLWRVQGLDQ
jgi:hypothetical protein